MGEAHLVSGYTCFSPAPDGAVPDTGGRFHRDLSRLSTLGVSITDANMTVLDRESIRPGRRTLTAVENDRHIEREVADDGVTFSHAYQDDDERRGERSTVVSSSDAPDDLRDGGAPAARLIDEDA